MNDECIDDDDCVEPSEFLKEVWGECNAHCFDNKLNEPGGLFWEDMDGSLGRFWPKFKTITINSDFKRVEELRAEIMNDCLAATPSMFNEFGNRFYIFIGVLVHEMVHQRVHEVYGSVSNDHGDEFILIANGIGNLPGGQWPECRIDNSAFWPILRKID